MDTNGGGGGASQDFIERPLEKSGEAGDVTKISNTEDEVSENLNKNNIGQCATNLIVTKSHDQKPELVAKPIKEGYEIGSYFFGNDIEVFLWRIQDELWFVEKTGTSITVYRDEGTFADMVLSTDSVIWRLLYANNNPEEFAGDNWNNDGVLWALEDEFEIAAHELRQSLDNMVLKLRVEPIFSAVSKEVLNQETPALKLIAVGGAEKLGSSPSTGETFWKVGDSYWCSEETTAKIRAEVLDRETVERSQVISALIPG